MDAQPTAWSRGIVRSRRIADLRACAVALAAVHESDGYPVEGIARPIEWLQPPRLLTAWVAELDDEIVGHVAISSPQHGDAVAALWTKQSGVERDKLAVMGRLFVVSSARGYSLGERLVTAAQADAANRGLRAVLDVMVKDQAAIRLYERLGWQFIGTTEHEFGEGQTTPAYCYVAPAP